MFLRQTLGRLNLFRPNLCQKTATRTHTTVQNNIKSSTAASIGKIATIRHTEDDSKIEIKFYYSNHTINMRKTFICVRQSNETIEYSLERVKAKIAHKIADKLRKKGLTVAPCDSLVVQLDGVTSEYDNWNKLLDNFNEIGANLVLKIDENNIYAIEYNPPLIKSISLPKEIFAGFDCYPCKLDSSGDLTKCTYKWKVKSPSNKTWMPCENADSFVYRVPENGIGYELKLICTSTNKDGIVISEQQSNKAIITDRGPNKEAIERRHKCTPCTLPDHQFRIVSYNLLADFYTDTEYSRTKLFPYATPSILDIDFRKQLFMHELLGYHCDVMCLQEVDQRIFEYDLCHRFGREHLKGVYTPKVPLPEGLAIFYNMNKFTLIWDQCVVLSDAVAIDPIHRTLYARILADKEFGERVLPLRNIVQILVLHCKSMDKYLVVANTHLYSQPNADDIRLLQAAIILNQIRSVIDATIAEHNLAENQVSPIFCGDFNSEPSDPIHQLVTNGIAKCGTQRSILDFIRRAHDLFMRRKNHDTFSMDCSLLFRSAYDNSMHTIFTHTFASCLDYIYYLSDGHTLIQTVPLPTTDVLSEHTAIPSIKFPSDHLAVVADFEWIQNA